MIKGLERLYGPQPWHMHEPFLKPDLPWSDDPAFVYNPAFEGSMETAAAESLYTMIRSEAERAKAAGQADFAVLETGCCDGFSTAFLAKAVEDAGIGHVWTCEFNLIRSTGTARPWPQLWRELELEHRITACIGDSRELATWRDADRSLPPDVDFIFLDSDHTARCVLAERDLLEPRLRSGGIISGHDTRLFTEVRQAFDLIASEYGTPTFEARSSRGLTWLRKP